MHWLRRGTQVDWSWISTQQKLILSRTCRTLCIIGDVRPVRQRYCDIALLEVLGVRRVDDGHVQETLVYRVLLSHAPVETYYQPEDEVGQEGGLCHCRQRVRTSCYCDRDGMGGKARDGYTLERYSRGYEHIRESKTSPPSTQTVYLRIGKEEKRMPGLAG